MASVSESETSRLLKPNEEPSSTPSPSTYSKAYKKSRKKGKGRGRSKVPPSIIITTTTEDETEKLEEDKKSVKEKPSAAWKRSKKGPISFSKSRPKTKRSKSRVFEGRNARNKTYKNWRKEAAAQLPSSRRSQLKKTRFLKTVESETRIEESKRSSASNSDDIESLPIYNLPNSRKSFAQRVSDLKKRQESIFVQMFEKSEPDSESSQVFIESDVEGNKSSDVNAENPQEEENWREKIAELKEMPEPLHKRRELRREIMTNVKKEHSRLKQTDIALKECLFNVAQEMEHFYHELRVRLTIWGKDIREIDSKYGRVAASYFEWLRRIILLNVFTFLISLFLIIIPEYVEAKSWKEVYHKQKPFHFGDLFHGEGSLRYTYLYYSGYHDRHRDDEHYLHVNPFQNNAIRFASAIMLILILNTWFVFVLIGRHYRSVQIETKVLGVAKMETFKSVICAWDFSCGDRTAASLLHKMIKQQLYVLSIGMGRDDRELAEIRLLEVYKLLAFLVHKFGLKRGDFLMHAISNLALILSCFVMGTTLFFLFQSKLDFYLDCVVERDDNVVRKLTYNSYCPEGDLYLEHWILSMPALYTSVLSLVLTKFIITVGEMEHFARPETKVYAMMIRAGIFNLTSISVFYLFWVNASDKMRAEGYIHEQIMGQEMYRLVVIQGVLDVLINFVVQYLYHLGRRIFKKDYKKPTFQPEYCAQEMFYLDSISRLGTMYCPPISLLVTLRLILSFYQNKYDLNHFSSHDTYITRSSSVFAPYVATFFVSYLVTGCFLGLYITKVHPSEIDGPFVHYRHSYAEALHQLLESTRETTWVEQLVSPGFLIILIVALGALVYLCREWAKSYGPIADQISELILLERSDKEILLKAIFQIARVTENAPSSSRGQLDSGGEDEEDKTDEKIEQLINFTRKKRSMDVEALNTTMQFFPSDPDQTERDLMIREQQRNHRRKIEKMVQEIVRERQRRKGVYLTTLPSSKKLQSLINKQTKKKGRGRGKGKEPVETVESRQTSDEDEEEPTEVRTGPEVEKESILAYRASMVDIDSTEDRSVPHVGKGITKILKASDEESWA